MKLLSKISSEIPPHPHMHQKLCCFCLAAPLNRRRVWSPSDWDSRTRRTERWAGAGVPLYGPMWAQ